MEPFLVLLSEDHRPRLLREIANELDNRGVHQHRRAWYEILRGIGADAEN